MVLLFGRNKQLHAEKYDTYEQRPNLGMNKGIAYIAEQIKKDEVDLNEPIIVLYSMTQGNSDRLIEKVGVKYSEKSEICAVIATHIGPHAAGYVYVKKAGKL